MVGITIGIPKLLANFHWEFRRGDKFHALCVNHLAGYLVDWVDNYVLSLLKETGSCWMTKAETQSKRNIALMLAVLCGVGQRL
jgi:hypothetical protein